MNYDAECCVKTPTERSFASGLNPCLAFPNGGDPLDVTTTAHAHAHTPDTKRHRCRVRLLVTVALRRRIKWAKGKLTDSETDETGEIHLRADTVQAMGQGESHNHDISYQLIQLKWLSENRLQLKTEQHAQHVSERGGQAKHQQNQTVFFLRGVPPTQLMIHGQSRKNLTNETLVGSLRTSRESNTVLACVHFLPGQDQRGPNQEALPPIHLAQRQNIRENPLDDGAEGNAREAKTDEVGVLTEELALTGRSRGRYSRRWKESSGSRQCSACTSG